MNFCLFFIALVLNAVTSCWALPDGAPMSACNSMMPLHRGERPQNERPPYDISADKIGNTDKVRVRISSPIGEQFQGFMLQARSNSDKSKFIPGEFTYNDESRAIDCFRIKKSTLTHKNTNVKTELVAEWTPSDGVDDDIIFRATVAKSFSVFWMEIDSKPIKIKSDAQNVDRKEGSNVHSMYDTCFNSKGCFGIPAGCAEKTDCEVLFTYALSPNGEGIRFGLHGLLNDNQYMAMGLSDDNAMGNDSVTECLRQGSDVKLRESWNEGRSNTRTREALQSNYDFTVNNGVTSCSWTKPLATQSNGRSYDLENNTYFILLARGPVSQGTLRYHNERIASGERVNFTAFEALGSEGSTTSVKIHGTFMVTAWVGFVSIAILLARHFKNTWENSTIGGVKVWFALHRIFMISALMFVIVAFIVIFAHKGGWNYQTSNPHAVLGCIATSLGLFNPIMAMFRPAPDHPNRPIFNWLHWAVGNSAQIIAVITIFFAVSLPSAVLKSSFYYVMSVFVIIHLLFHLLYQIHAWTEGKKKSNELSMNEMNGSRNPQNGHTSHANLQAANISANVFRILLLGIYCIFLLVILITLYALIAYN